MQYIALILCLVLVAVLIKIDRAASPGLTKALWIPTAWFLYCATRPIGEWFRPLSYGAAMTGVTGAGGSMESGNFLDRNVLLVLMVAGFFVLQRRGISWRQFMRNNRWLAVLFLYMLVSVLWSEFPFVSFKRWIRTGGTVIMALVVLSEPSPYEAMQAVIRRTVYFVIPFSAVFVKYFPRIGVTFGRWNGNPEYAGATLNKNTLAEVCIIFLLYFVWALVKRREAKGVGVVRMQSFCEIILVFLALFLMRGPTGYGAKGATYSATCIAALVVGVGVFFCLRQFKRRLAHLGRWVALGLIGGGAVVLAMNVAGVSPTALAAQALGRRPDLSGRSDLIWSVLLPIAERHALLGQGYGSFWIRPVPNLTLDVNEAHNGYLDVFLELGLTGLLLLGLVFVAYFRKARNDLESNFNWAAFRLSFLIMFMMHNWTESTLLRPRELLWSLFVLLFLVYPKDWPGYEEEEMIGEDEAPMDEETASITVGSTDMAVTN
jgi:O-antigen ligase